MKKQRFLLTMCTMLAGAVAALPQEPAPAPRPMPPVAPAAPIPPVPPAMRYDPDDLQVQVDVQIHPDEIRERVKAQMESLDELRESARIKAEAAGDMARFSFADRMFGKVPGFAFIPQKGRHSSDDRDYERGQRALDSRNWDDAVEKFTQAASAGGPRADGALYWKAYALAKLGKRDDAVAAIAELRKSYATSRWLDDAKALELEVKQAGGQKVTPESENDEELKLMAINGLMQSDQERALPLLENLLKTSSSPKLKERALFVLAQSNTARGKQVLEQVARGGAGNPDLQLKAISYVSASSKQTDNRQLLWEIYTSSNDNQVKRAILRGLMNARDKDHVLQIAKTDKSTQLRMEAISFLGSNGAQAELWQIYPGETSPEVKQEILHAMISSGSSDRLVEIAKTEKDAKLKRSAIQALGSMGATKTGDALVSMYGSETDPAVKRTIVDGLHSQRNAKAMVDLARKESDPAMKRELVSRLSNMKSKEAADYLMELLK
jgi:hypothetical protein